MNRCKVFVSCFGFHLSGFTNFQAALYVVLDIPVSYTYKQKITYLQVLRQFHVSSACPKSRPVPAEFVNDDNKKSEKSLTIYDDLFEQVSKEAKTKATFNKVVDIFTKTNVRRRGHVEFIYAALKKMPEFGVEKDLTVYNRLLDVFPKEVFVPRNFIQRMFNHYPRQQECGVQLLEQMENYGGCLSHSSGCMWKIWNILEFREAYSSQ